MGATSFRFKEAVFDFGDGQPVEVRLVADQKSKKSDTHFTLLMGANGTCKSRLLSCCVNFLKNIDEQMRAPSPKKPSRPQKHFDSDHDMRCSSAELIRDGVLTDLVDGSSIESADSLPSRVLAVANLVRDRFTFVDRDDFKDPFYYYLGVRQASNLTTTGAMDRLVCDAVLGLLNDEEAYLAFSKWAKELFPLSEKGLSFSKFSREKIHDFMADPLAAIKRRVGAVRSQYKDTYNQQLNEVMPHMNEISLLADVIENHGVAASHSGSVGMQGVETRTLHLDRLPAAIRSQLGKLSHVIPLALKNRLITRPSLVLSLQKWLDFTQLSSGEQNLLATGARLFAFAKPGSFIVIDEPEVSLNVAWQQRYIDLISQALRYAKGSHVVIASHSPYLVSDLQSENSTVVVIERKNGSLTFRSNAGEFWGWGSEAILYEVLGLPSASNFLFSRELAKVLALVRDRSRDTEAFRKFLKKCDQLDFANSAASVKVVIDEVREYAGKIAE